MIPFFLQQRHGGVLPITDPQMTRFNITLEEGVKMVLWSIENGRGSEIFVPKIPSYRITAVATAIAPQAEQRVVGIRPGEKIHEEMITSSDSYNTWDLGYYYAILPSEVGDRLENYYCQTGAVKVPQGFSYNSGSNETFLTVEELRELIKQHVDPEFT